MCMVLERNLFEDGACCIGTPVSIRKAFARMCMGEGGDVSCHVKLPFSSQGQLCNWQVRLP